MIRGIAGGPSLHQLVERPARRRVVGVARRLDVGDEALGPQVGEKAHGRLGWARPGWTLQRRISYVAPRHRRGASDTHYAMEPGSPGWRPAASGRVSATISRSRRMPSSRPAVP